MNDFRKVVNRNGLNFVVVSPSVLEGALYSVYQGKSLICSFGSKSEGHYCDRLGNWNELDHKDMLKRKRWLRSHMIEYSVHTEDMTACIWWERNYLY